MVLRDDLVDEHLLEVVSEELVSRAYLFSLVLGFDPASLFREAALEPLLICGLLRLCVSLLPLAELFVVCLLHVLELLFRLVLLQPLQLLALVDPLSQSLELLQLRPQLAALRSPKATLSCLAWFSLSPICLSR